MPMLVFFLYASLMMSVSPQLAVLSFVRGRRL